MRPKKTDSEKRVDSCIVRLTQDEKLRFGAQAKIRGMDLSAYIRAVMLEEGERLVDSGKLQRAASGRWEILNMGSWEKI